ncbi:MAG: hypothetical protein GX327_07135 [Epulopiscium sp.]|nr:hypothetical protein [Candidatus Epulonipiscium sp.]
MKKSSKNKLLLLVIILPIIVLLLSIYSIYNNIHGITNSNWVFLVINFCNLVFIFITIVLLRKDSKNTDE